MPTLQLLTDYARRDVHDIFEPETQFTPQAGSWGLHGIIPLKDRPGDFVLFVTFGQEQGDHEFDEGISVDGVLRWQSQPHQSFKSSQIQQFIAHDEAKNQIYLFLRTSARARGSSAPYTYLGRLKYVTHDAQRERPVHFAWQLLDWPIPDTTCRRIDLSLEGEGQPQPEDPQPTNGLQRGIRPAQAEMDSKNGTTTRQFLGRIRASSPENDKRKKNLGLAGELAVLEFEKRKLANNGQPEWANQVRHVSVQEGDGAGYDILSFRENGSKLYIEVKTTSGPAKTDFFVSANEVAFSAVHAEDYELRRVYDFNEHNGFGSFFSIYGNLLDQVMLIPTEYRVKS